ncbi:MAG: 16S rRNA (adenine(1518)-N(6)/adenine(1519)-N(6))-dimethyltransferase RsmA [Bacteroidales bacterium]
MAKSVLPKKKLGQHFLADDNIARKIVASLTIDGENHKVLEIGPGTGMLSKHLMNRNDVDWYGLEVDTEAILFLQQTYPAFSNRIIKADFLAYDLDQISTDEPLAIIGNFPYNISSQIMFKVLAERQRIPLVVGMFQKEVARRIASPPGSKEYGILSVLIQAFYDVQLLFSVEPHVFIPPPKVQSTVIRCVRKTGPDIDCNVARFFTVVKMAFNQRRKTLKNSLKAMNVHWEALPGHLAKERPERLGVNDFAAITRQAGESRNDVK